MEYKHIDGNVYFRYASTPPVINTDLAMRIGIQGPCPMQPGQYAGFEIGRNVKLRLTIDHGTRKMTCHAKIDWVKQEKETGQWVVGFSQLSFTEEEFLLLQQHFVEESDKRLEFGPTVRDKAKDALSVTATEKVREIMRLKAVNFPVSVIEAIDENRGTTTFSEFVTAAVRDYLKRKE